ncbi:MAG: hypothetical protein OXP69_11375 [Spirochaetaceae bacterium]|nr:hypothetical protein [Spirochaetaceae bacterium]
MMDIHGGMHPAEVPTYTPTEVARIIRRPVSTVRSWTRGARYMTNAGEQFWPPVVTADPPYLSFQNLVELYVLSSLRNLHGVRLSRIRIAIDYLRKVEGTTHPLADYRLLTDRSDVFVETAGEYLNLSRDGQLELKAQLLKCMKQVDRGIDGFPNKLWLLDSRNNKAAEVDPEIRFGQPRIPGTGIPLRLSTNASAPVKRQTNSPQRTNGPWSKWPGRSVSRNRAALREAAHLLRGRDVRARPRRLAPRKGSARGYVPRRK